MKFLRTLQSTQPTSQSYFTRSVASEFFWKKNEKPVLARLKEQYGNVWSNKSSRKSDAFNRGSDKATTASSKLNEDTTQIMMMTSMNAMHSISDSNHHLHPNKSKSIHQDANDSNDSTSSSDYSSSYSSPSCSSSSSDSGSSD